MLLDGSKTNEKKLEQQVSDRVEGAPQKILNNKWLCLRSSTAAVETQLGGCSPTILLG